MYNVTNKKKRGRKRTKRKERVKRTYCHRKRCKQRDRKRRGGREGQVISSGCHTDEHQN